jgi:uncharacterized protein
MEQRLSLVTLGVDDLKRAVGFYEKLGWKRANASDDVAFFQLHGMIFALWSWKDLAADAKLPPDGSGFRGMSLAYNARSREDVDAAMSEAERAGATMLKPAEETPWGGYSGYFADLDGHLWEVAHNPAWEISPEGAARYGG